MDSSAVLRADGLTYIDDKPPSPSPPSSSGSSVEEDSDSIDEPPIWVEHGETSSLSLSGDDEVNNNKEIELGEENSPSWEVDDEDWELAHGDFTKHYNRLRQQHAAVNSQPTASSSRPPLPSRNINVASASSSKSVVNPSVLTGGVATNPKAALDRHEKDKSDRATQEQVLDARTRLVLSGLINRGIIGRIERCISTGKEANVYFASSEHDGLPRAVKVYRTSILNFRSRQAYIVGEHRFRGEYSSSRNPRKMIRVWAEKEFRNLRRLQQGNVRTPRVYECKENVLVMEFLGDGVSASPRLKDASIPEDRLAFLYAEMIVTMRRMFQDCHLVHADLSEYNILYHNSHLYIIDVSQSVEHDHPRSFDFLRTDIRNVKDFFARLSDGSIRMLSLRRTWEFIVNERIEGVTTNDEADLLNIFDAWINGEELDETDDAVFMSSFIPRNLSEVYDPERDVELLKIGDGEKLIYAGLTGLSEAKNVEPDDVKVEEEATKSTGKVVRFEGDQSEESDQSSSEEQLESKPRGFRHEDRNSKKERKKAVKEEQRERRQKKMSKAEKHRLIKKSSGR